jgi:integrase
MYKSWLKQKGTGVKLGKLTATKVEKTKQAGMYGDGGGLWLQVRARHVKSWIFRYTFNGKARVMGLGSASTVSLARAREDAAHCRLLVHEGKNPLVERDAQRAKGKRAAANSITFKECTAGYLAAHRTAWRSEKHATQWESSVASYAYPILGPLPVADIDVGLIMRVLGPLWSRAPETASRVRGRIESVLDWATAQNYRQGDNPARWKGNIAHLLPKRSKAAPVQHHPALAYREMGQFMAELRQQSNIIAPALEFLILTATRMGETRGARWAEIDWDERLWTIPSGRTKGHREHRVPLSEAAMAVLERQRTRAQGDFVFPGLKPGTPLSGSAMGWLMAERMNRRDITVHGFRSAFRDWAAEQTAFPREVAEMALGHAVGNQVEAAYRRGDLREKRRKLMEAWAAYCAAPVKGGKVVQMRRAGEGQ